jgi:pimeloyl-ACP methyl ester carboxylesterase
MAPSIGAFDDHAVRKRFYWAGAAGLAVLAGSAIVTESRRRRAEHLHPPDGRFIAAGGALLHYTDTGGDRPPLVLLHGNGSMIADMGSSGIIERAAEQFRVIAFDRPGYGYSGRPHGRAWTPKEQARVLRTALAGLGVSSPIVLGHSWGTMVALSIAMDHPDYVRGLVLVSGYYFPTFRPETALVAPTAAPVIGGLLRHTVSPLIFRAMLPRAIRRIFAPQPVPDRFARTFSLDLAARPLPLRASSEESLMMIPAARRLEEGYGSLRLPVAILAGTADRIADPRAHSQRLHEIVAGSTLRLLPGTGHMLHHHAPAEVVDAIGEVSRRPAQQGKRSDP